MVKKTKTIQLLFDNTKILRYHLCMRIGDIMNKKAFTMVELLAVILILGIILVIAAASYNSYLKTSREKSFKLAENSFRDTVEEAYIDCSANLSKNNFCQNHDKLVVGETDTIKLSELITSGYIETIKNPYNTNESCDINNSYVKVTNVNTSNGVSEYSYDVCLICGNKTSNGCN